MVTPVATRSRASIVHNRTGHAMPAWRWKQPLTSAHQADEEWPYWYEAAVEKRYLRAIERLVVLLATNSHG